MNQEAQKVLSDLLQRAVNGIDEAVAFSQAQIPDVVSQLLMWKVTEAISASVISAVVLCTIIGLFSKYVASWRGKADFDSEVIYDVLWLMFGGTTSLAALSVLICNLLNAVKILIAPKLYLIEYAADLVK